MTLISTINKLFLEFMNNRRLSKLSGIYFMYTYYADNNNYYYY